MTEMVSVVIPAYNATRTIERALASVFSQSGSYEVIVVDDGSRDETARIIDEGYGYRVRCIRQENAGPAAARNRGIREARGAYVAFLDADDEWLPGKLASQLEILERDPGCALCFTDMSHWEGNLEVHPSYLKERGFTRVCSGMIYQDLLGGCFIFTPTVLVRRSALEHVGNFDEGLRIAEDYDLWLRIARRFPVAFLDRPLLRRYRTGCNITGDRALYLECHLRLFRKLLAEAGTSRTEKSVLSRRLAETHHNAGYHEREEGRAWVALRHYGQSLRYRPAMAALKGLIACLLPPSLKDAACGIIKRRHNARRS